jgi:hypothetical protein
MWYEPCPHPRPRAAIQAYPAAPDIRLNDVRRVSALLLFTLGYGLMALFEPAVSALPALASFLAGAAVLVRPREERDEVARLVRDPARR